MEHLSNTMASIFCTFYIFFTDKKYIACKIIGVCHIPMEPAFNPRTSEILIQAAKKLGYNIRKGGTIVTIEGPRFSSKAESNAFRLWGGHLVNMTICPEVYSTINLCIN